MRIIAQTRTEFSGTHKGASIDIQREPDGTYYIIVKARDGSYLYDGWAPKHVTNMRLAKIEALRGAQLT